MKKNFIRIIVAFFAVFAVWFIFLRKDADKQEFKTQKLTKGSITETITASGIINPISTISIGTQVSGTISEIYVDYNSEVKKGQLLALIDPDMFKATLAQRTAALEIAKAEVDVVKNDIVYYKKHLDRIKKLKASNYSTEKELESAQRDYDNAVVQLALREAQVKQADAAMQYAQTELNYTKIESPVDGIVISKSVEVGQTVAASFSTPELFSVAEDLTKMEIDTSVVEADISKVKEGQTVEFSVDSYPDVTFVGKITQVRNEPITVSNVVTYSVIVEIDNSDNKLKPGMTANVTIITNQKNDVLIVPNQALRISMNDKQNAVYKDRGIWLLKKGKPERVGITLGISDDNNTEIFSDNLQEGDEVIVEKTDAKDKKRSRMGMPRR